jgi:hypothetical protein
MRLNRRVVSGENAEDRRRMVWLLCCPRASSTGRTLAVRTVSATARQRQRRGTLTVRVQGESARLDAGAEAGARGAAAFATHCGERRHCAASSPLSALCAADPQRYTSTADSTLCEREVCLSRRGAAA